MVQRHSISNQNEIAQQSTNASYQTSSNTHSTNTQLQHMNMNKYGPTRQSTSDTHNSPLGSHNTQTHTRTWPHWHTAISSNPYTHKHSERRNTPIYAPA